MDRVELSNSSQHKKSALFVLSLLLILIAGLFLPLAVGLVVLCVFVLIALFLSHRIQFQGKNEIYADELGIHFSMNDDSFYTLSWDKVKQITLTRADEDIYIELFSEPENPIEFDKNTACITLTNVNRSIRIKPSDLFKNWKALNETFPVDVRRGF